VGASVGSAVGLSVVGTSVGHAELGWTDGASVGTRDGVAVGTSVGKWDIIAGVNRVGVSVGHSVGAPVGANEGNHVEASVLFVVEFVRFPAACTAASIALASLKS